MKKISVTGLVKRLTDTRKREVWFSSGWAKICTDSYWDGGSISYWLVVNSITGRQFRPPAGQFPWTTPNDYILQTGDVVIETGRSNNKEAMPIFRCRTEDEAAVLTWLGVK